MMLGTLPWTRPGKAYGSGSHRNRVGDINNMLIHRAIGEASPRASQGGQGHTAEQAGCLSSRAALVPQLFLNFLEGPAGDQSALTVSDHVK